MNGKIYIAMLGIALLSACSDSTQQAQGKGPRQYDKMALAQGERVFQANCTVCHGYRGEAKPGWQNPGPDGKLQPPPLDDSGRTWRLTSSQMKQFIHQGSPAERSHMPAWRGKLTEQEIDNVATWITSLWSDAVYLEWLTRVEQQKN